MVRNTLLTIIICPLFLLPLNAYSSESGDHSAVQQNCDQSCEEYFCNIYDDGYSKTDKVLEINAYKNHYNKRMRACIMSITTSRNRMYWKRLFNVHTNKTYGEYISMTNGDPIVYVCRVLDEECKSEEEWDLLVRPIMEE